MFESISSFINKGKEAVVNTGLDTFARGPINNYMEGILEVQSIQLPKITFTLAGLPDQVFTVEAGMINISESGDKVMLGDFRSDTEFVKNALNRFVPKVIEIEDPKIQKALCAVRGTVQR